MGTMFVVYVECLDSVLYRYRFPFLGERWLKAVVCEKEAEVCGRRMGRVWVRREECDGVKYTIQFSMWIQTPEVTCSVENTSSEY